MLQLQIVLRRMNNLIEFIKRELETEDGNPITYKANNMGLVPVGHHYMCP